MRQNKNDIDTILINFFTKNSSEEELNLLQEFINSSAANKQYVKETFYSFNHIELALLQSKANLDKSWEKIEQAINKKKTVKFNAKLFLGVAATIALLVSTVLLPLMLDHVDQNKLIVQSEHIKPGKINATLTLADGHTIDLLKSKELIVAEQNGKVIKKDASTGISYNTDDFKTKEEIFNTITVPHGGEYQLTLSDGTQVWLNSESKLTYPVSFINNKRVVVLEGEAMLKVAHNKEKPFILSMGENSVKVLGTEFNVSNYSKDNNCIITLAKGSVQVYSPFDSLQICPDTQVLIQNKTSQLSSRKVDAKIFTAWVDGVFEFENEKLEYICAKLSRWYNVDFVFDDNLTKSLHFTGAAKKQDSIGYILRIIEESTHVKFVISATTITVKNI